MNDKTRLFLDALRAHGQRVTATGGQWLAQCPAHDDQRASLSVGDGDNGGAVVNCQAGCATSAVVASVGWTMADLMPDRAVSRQWGPVVEHYDYRNESGTVLYRVKRHRDPKNFSQWRPDQAGGFVAKLDGVKRRVVYRLDRLHKARPVRVYVAEGEKDVHALETFGLVATTNAGGASKSPDPAKAKWRPEFARQLQACGVTQVCVLPDNDEAGAAHARAVAAACHTLGLAVKVVTLPGLADHGDVSDWIGAGGTKAQLEELARSAPKWEPSTLPVSTTAAASAFASAGDADDPVLDPDAARTNHLRLVRGAVERVRAQREARRIVDAEERGAVVVPPLETLRECLGRPRDPLQWRIRNWQPRHTRVMLVAQFKAGKTTLVGNLLRSLIDGDDFLGRDEVMAIDGSVALVDFEMSSELLVDWLQAQRIRADDRIFLQAMRGRVSSFNILDDRVRAEWAERFRSRQVRYLVLDCLRPILDVLGLDENHEAGRFLVAFDALLEESGIREAVIVDHMGHAGERARGDSRKRDWPDAEWRLVRQGDDKGEKGGNVDPAAPRFITAYGRGVDVRESQLTYDPHGRRLTVSDGTRQDARTATALSQALTVVLDELDLAGSTMPSGNTIKTLIKTRLAETAPPRDTIDAALKHGVATGVLTVTDGPRNGQYYTRPAPVSGVSGSFRSGQPEAGIGGVEFPAPLRRPETRKLTDAVPVSGDVPETSSPTLTDDQTGGGFGKIA